MPPSTRRNTFTPLEPQRKRPTAAVGPRSADVESSPARPLLLLAAVAALAATVVGCRPAPPPLPTPWPEQFHAVVITNLPGGGRRPAAAADRHLLRLAARTRPERHPPPALRRWRWQWPAPGRPVGPEHLRPVRRRILPATPSTAPWGSYRSTGKLAAPPAGAATASTDSTNTSGPSVQLTLISLLRGCRHRTPYRLDCRRCVCYCCVEL